MNQFPLKFLIAVFHSNNMAGRLQLVLTNCNLTCLMMLPIIDGMFPMPVLVIQTDTSFTWGFCLNKEHNKRNEAVM